jgi:hypothetical protein
MKNTDNGKVIATTRSCSYQGILPNTNKVENIQWDAIPQNAELTSYIVGAFAFGAPGGLAFSGPYRGFLNRIDGDTVGGGLGAQPIPVAGFIASNGSTHIWNSDTNEILIEGQVNADSTFTFTTPYGLKSGTMTMDSEIDNSRNFYLSNTPYNLSLTFDSGASGL